MNESSAAKVVTSLVWFGPPVVLYLISNNPSVLVFATIWLVVPAISILIIASVVWSHPDTHFPKNHFVYRLLYEVRDNRPVHINLCDLPEDFFIALFLNAFAFVLMAIFRTWAFLNCQKIDSKLNRVENPNWPLHVKGRNIKPLWFVLIALGWWHYESLSTLGSELFHLSVKLSSTQIGGLLLTIAGIALAIKLIRPIRKRSSSCKRLFAAWGDIFSSIKDRFCLSKSVK